MTFAILHHDTLSTVGLRHILHTYFDIEAQCFTSAAAFLSSAPEQYDGYWVTAQQFVACIEVLLPRKSRVVLLSERKSDGEWSGMSVDVSLPVEDIVEQVNKAVRAIAGSHRNNEVQEELTQREVEVLRGVARGLINKEIADELHISINTVLSHRKNIVAKLGIKTVSGLSLYAMMNGIIAPGE